MYSNSIKEYTRFVAEKLGYSEIDDKEIDQLMFSWGLSPIAEITDDKKKI